MNAVEMIITATLLCATAHAERPAKFVSLEDRLAERATKILIPSIEFKDTTLADALEFLRSEAKAHDPKHQGVPIEPEVKPWPAPLDARITLSLQNASLDYALNVAAALVGCKLVPSRKALTISPAEIQVERAVTHTIPLAGVPSAEIARMQKDPMAYFADRGVHFSSRASCSLEDAGMTLVVTDTYQGIWSVYAVLEDLGRSKPSKKSK